MNNIIKFQKKHNNHNHSASTQHFPIVVSSCYCFFSLSLPYLLSYFGGEPLNFLLKKTKTYIDFAFKRLCFILFARETKRIRFPPLRSLLFSEFTSVKIYCHSFLFRSVFVAGHQQRNSFLDGALVTFSIERVKCKLRWTLNNELSFHIIRSSFVKKLDIFWGGRRGN